MSNQNLVYQTRFLYDWVLIVAQVTTSLSETPLAKNSHEILWLLFLRFASLVRGDPKKLRKGTLAQNKREHSCKDRKSKM